MELRAMRFVIESVGPCELHAGTYQYRQSFQSALHWRYPRISPRQPKKMAGSNMVSLPVKASPGRG